MFVRYVDELDHDPSTPEGRRALESLAVEREARLVERAYRRGYQHAAEEAIALVRSGAPARRLELWGDRVQDWRDTPRVGREPPPTP